jgi:broad specificity phosphatase PhoE
LTSPPHRAAETCRLAGFEGSAREELVKWDCGEFEGRTTLEIRDEWLGWSLWRDGVPGGETAEDVGRRTDRVIEELQAIDGDTVVFAHGHLLRVLAARWLGLEPRAGRLFALDPSTISILAVRAGDACNCALEREHGCAPWVTASSRRGWAVDGHAKARLPRPLPRVGTISLARLVAEVGPLLERTASADESAALCGAVPVTKRIRILARAWLRVTWTCWHTDTPYNPARRGGHERHLVPVTLT